MSISVHPSLSLNTHLHRFQKSSSPLINELSGWVESIQSNPQYREQPLIRKEMAIMIYSSFHVRFSASGNAEWKGVHSIPILSCKKNKAVLPQKHTCSTTCIREREKHKLHSFLLTKKWKFMAENSCANSNYHKQDAQMNNHQLQ